LKGTKCEKTGQEDDGLRLAKDIERQDKLALQRRTIHLRGEGGLPIGGVQIVVKI